jgi:hypothetical protein
MFLKHDAINEDNLPVFNIKTRQFQSQLLIRRLPKLLVVSTAMPIAQEPAVVIDDPEGKGPCLRRRKLVLCFDGTGNKFLGNAGDSNSKPAPQLIESRSVND